MYFHLRFDAFITALEKIEKTLVEDKHHTVHRLSYKPMRVTPMQMHKKILKLQLPLTLVLW